MPEFRGFAVCVSCLVEDWEILVTSPLAQLQPHSVVCVDLPWKLVLFKKELQ